MAEGLTVKPLPNINDAAAMIERGKRSALASARKEAHELLRNAAVNSQPATWDDLTAHADIAETAAARLKTLAAMWNELA